MSGGKLIRTLRMPNGIPELIQFALEPLQAAEFIVAEDVLSCRMRYVDGTTLTIVILYVEERHLLLFTKPVISISVVEMDDDGIVSRKHLQYSIERPSNPHDMNFCTQLMARVAAMTRAVADDLGAGECVD